MARKAPSWLTLVSALLLVASFPPWGFSALIWVCLVPWFYALQRTSSGRRAALEGIWLSFLINLLGFGWVAYVLHEFGNLPWALSIPAFLIFALFAQPQFILLAPLLRRLQREPADDGSSHPAARWFLPLATALLYAGSDWALPKIFTDTLGHSMHSAPELRQIADLGGAYLITALIFLTNEAIYTAIRSWENRRLAIPHLTYSLVALIAALTYGQSRLAQVRELVAKSPLSVRGAAIQGNIGDFDKVAAERGITGAAEKVLSTYFSLSDEALALDNRKPDFLVWPETAYPSTFRTPNTAHELELDQKMENYVRSRKIPLLFGGYDHWEKKDYNALFMLTPTADPGLSGTGDLRIYRKNILLMFGEYIPGAESIKPIRDAFPQVGNFGRGTGPELLSIAIPRAPAGHIKTGPIICYEALFPNYVIEAARKGSQLILNVTNDSWFGPYAEPPLHLSLVAFRSIETRLPQLRATNTGISALILPDGEITNATATGEQAILGAEIPIHDPIPTLMKKWGDWFGPFALIAGLLFLVPLLSKV